MKMNKHALLSSIFSVFVLGCFYLWFVFQDRRLVFLYGHLHTTPFDVATLSRHWVAGLVASGFVFALGVTLFLLAKKTTPLDVKKIWKTMCMIILLPLIIMLWFGNTLTTPLALLGLIIVVLFLSIRLALEAAATLVNKPKETFILWLDGLILVPFLVLVALLADYVIRKFDSLESMLPTLLVWGSFLILSQIIWFFVMNTVHRKTKIAHFSSSQLLLSAITTTYVFLPLAHYLTSRSYHLYITNSGNIMSSHWWVQLGVFTLVWMEIVVISKLRTTMSLESKKDVRNIFFLLTGIVFLNVFVIHILKPTTTNNIWLCKGNHWIAVGQPRYEKPFAEECGVIDKAMGL